MLKVWVLQTIKKCIGSINQCDIGPEIQIFSIVHTSKRLFAPTSQSPMSKLFIFTESFGKSNGKKWSQIWKLLLTKGVKLPNKNSLFIFFFSFFSKFVLLAGFFLVLVLLFTLGKSFFVSHMRDFSKKLYKKSKVERLLSRRGFPNYKNQVRPGIRPSN